MILTRLLILLCLIWLLFRIYRWMKQGYANHTGKEKRVPTVRCSYCETYIDRDDAYRSGDMFFCDELHYKAYKQKSRQ